jgi:hypothetical protein
MGVRTSIYLDDDLHAAWKASGVPGAEVFRRGLGARLPEEVAAVRAVEAGAEAARVEHRELRDEIAVDVREAVRDEVRSALRDLQGGGL